MRQEGLILTRLEANMRLMFTSPEASDRNVGVHEAGGQLHQLQIRTSDCIFDKQYVFQRLSRLCPGGLGIGSAAAGPRHQKRCIWPHTPRSHTPSASLSPPMPVSSTGSQEGGKSSYHQGASAPPLTQTFHCACVMKLALKVYARLEVIPTKLPVMKNLIEIFTHTSIVSELSQAQVDR